MSGGADHRQEVSSSHPQWATKKSDQLTQALVRKSTETKSKMAAMLDERRSWSSKGTFLYAPPISHRKIRWIDPGVCHLIDGNQIQDGDHLGFADHRKEPSSSHPQ
jgi:hypothetical protein